MDDIRRLIHLPLTLPARYHFFGSLAIVLLVLLVMAVRIADRQSFADGELYRQVAERWGAPIDQPVPSVRFVESGSVWNRLESLPLASQRVRVNADMNYRKRGLVYFSGFDFHFDGRYTLRNDRGKTIDVVFVLPLPMIKDQVLLSDLQFDVDGDAQRVELADGRDRLQWSGRLEDGESTEIAITFRGRGLNRFTYRLDPSLPVRDFTFELAIAGGRGYDYASGVMPAVEATESGDSTVLAWRYDALEAGVPVGATLPSEEAWDDVVLKMLGHATPAFLLFFASLVAIFEAFKVRPRLYQMYLLAAGWVFFYVLLPYLGAFLHFYLAWALAIATVAMLLTSFVVRLIGPEAKRYLLIALAPSLLVPSMAVMLQGYTGLIYTVEILAILAILMRFATRDDIVEALDALLTPRPELPPNPDFAEGTRV
ncbi:MAG: hypothetical protein AAGM22_16360 [Acidobacteriota bacterium]